MNEDEEDDEEDEEEGGLGLDLKNVLDNGGGFGFCLTGLTGGLSGGFDSLGSEVALGLDLAESVEGVGSVEVCNFKKPTMNFSDLVNEILVFSLAIYRVDSGPLLLMVGRA